MTKVVPYLSKEAIERDAEALLAEYTRARRTVTTLPIPIDDIVEKHLKLSLELADTHKVVGVPRHPEQEPDILGVIYPDEARIVIDYSLDPDENPIKEGRYRFTLGHEVGHWRLHRPYFKSGPSSVVCRSSQAKERMEWQADFYASCLLMPRNLVREAWRNAYGSVEPFVFDTDKDTSIDRRELRFELIAGRFAPAFVVSPAAMRVRLEHLGLLVRDDSRQQVLAGYE